MANGKRTGVGFRNKVRGALSVVKNRKPSKNDNQHLNFMRIAAQAISETLSEAKATLPRSELMEFERWLEIQTASLNGSDSIASSQETLGVLPENVRPSRLADTLQQTVDTIARHEEALRSFGKKLLLINQHINSLEYHKALAATEAVIKSEGLSYWAIEAKIALLYKINRVNDAKDYINKLSIGAPGLNAFHFYHFGLRNESSQSFSRYKSIIKRRIAESTLSDSYQIYAQYRSARILSESPAGLSDVLSYELLTSKIDLYLTACRISIQILANPSSHKDIERSLALKLLFATSIDASVLTPAASPKSPLTLPTRLDETIYYAIATCLGIHFTTESQETVESLASRLVTFFSYSGSEAEENSLRKDILNFWWQPEAMLLDSSTRIIRLPDLYTTNPSEIEASEHPVNAACLRHFKRLTQEKPDVVPATVTSANEFDQIQLTQTVLDCISVRDSWRSLEDCDYETCLRTIQRGLLRNSRLISALPLSLMFQSADFQKISSYGISLDLCNCIHRYSQVNHNRKLKTYKRFIIEELMDSLDAKGLLDLAHKLAVQEPEKNFVEYFLAQACDVATIELLDDGADGTIEALQTRASLLRVASDISASSKAQLIAEADLINAQLKLDGVLQELDKTMVSVDEESLIPIVATEIAGDFERYRKIQFVGSSKSSSVDDLVWSLKQQSASTFQIPKSEADDLLIQMIYTVLDRFIEDPVYGLDAIVGRRIRHGTISDELRGALEKLQLIGHRPKSGADYKLPKTVVTQLEAFESANKVGVTRAFIRFSAAIDQLVAMLRDEVFYSRQPKLAKPKQRHSPVFDLPIGVLTIAVAKDAATISRNAEGFVRELFDAFWLQLSASLERHRPQIGQLINHQLKDAFARLFSDVKSSGVNDATFLASLQRASEDLHLRGEVIKNWVRIPKITYEGKRYPLSMVYDAAMALVKSKRPAFEPQSTVAIDSNIQLDAHGFPIAFDAVRIAIENIAKHSGVKAHNKIFVNIRLNESRDKLLFTFESDMSKDAWTRDKAQKVDSIREDIQQRNYGDRARKTSESGIAKLATIVKQRENCALEFGGIEGNSKFRLYFELVYVGLEPELSAVTSLGASL